MIILIIIIILIITIIILRQLCSFHCNCFVCSMLDLIYSSSILIDSCRCLPGQKKKIIIFSSLVEKKNQFFLSEENMEHGGRLQISHGAQLRGRGRHIRATSSFERPLR